MNSGQIVYPTTCWECSTKCGSLVTVEDGKAVKVGPNKAHPASLGAFCVKGIRGLPELNDHEKRVLYPMKRDGERGSGKWTRISWDEALDEMADRLLAVREAHGPLSLAGAVSSAYFSRGAMVALLMRSLGSPNWMMNQDLCGGCRALSDKLTGLTSVGAEDVDNTSCALIVGRNPSAADPAQWMALKRARDKGAKIITIDPARIPASDMADIWLRPRPGTDAAIGLAMAHVMITEDLHDREFVNAWCHGFDQLAERAALFPPSEAARLSGVPADDIVAAARMYADGPSTFISGHGIDSSSAGVQTFRAFHSLVAISGNLDRVGGNRRVKRPKGFRNYIDILHDPAFRLPREIEEQTIGAAQFPLWAGPDGWQTATHNPSVIEAMLTGKPYPVRALHVTGVNIAVTYPDTKRVIAALESLDFLSVATHMMTPTAEYADLVLPKATSLEEEEVSLDPAGPCVSFTRAIQAPRGEARSDFAFTTDLARRLEARGIDTRPFFPWETKRQFNEFMLGENDISFDQLEKDGFANFPYELRNFDAVGFKTPTGKIELYSETLAKLGLDPVANYEPPRAERDGQDAERDAEDGFPLILLTGAREKTYHHSRYRDQAWARKVSAFPRLQVHPDTAATQGLKADDWVAVQTKGGSGKCQLLVTVTEDVPAGIVRTGMGWWLPEADGPDRAALTVNINTAISYDGPWDPITGSADTGGLPCRLEKLTTGIIMKQEAMA
jgi:thiosulfate reductase / polysulfide reductase chain A